MITWVGNSLTSPIIEYTLSCINYNKFIILIGFGEYSVDDCMSTFNPLIGSKYLQVMVKYKIIPHGRLLYSLSKFASSQLAIIEG